METFLWVEKYRPNSIDACILPNELKSTFSEIVKDKHIPNLILSGGPGVGKTTVAKAMIEEIGATYMMINGSEESGIDVLRTKIKNFASTVSLEGGRKYIILDEADYLNPQSTQPALRGFIEEFSKNCRFIFTCNYKNRIIQPLHSRCSVIDFTIESSQKPQIAGGIFQRILQILKTESIEYNEQVVVELVQKFFPDFRRVLNELQKYSASGKIDSGVLANLDDESLQEVLGFIRDKEFSKMRKWVALNIHNDPQAIYRKIYDALFTRMENSSVPQAIIILSDYTYKSAFVADQEVNMVACMTELMMECKLN